MAEPAAATPTTPTGPLASGRHKLWEQQPGENDLWYVRFLRFVAIGPGRSVSLVATGRRNAYPVPAHWPIQAKQRSWRERAKAFDSAAHSDPKLIEGFNNLLTSFVASATNGEAEALGLTAKAGGYHAPPEEEDYGEDENYLRPSTGR